MDYYAILHIPHSSTVIPEENRLDITLSDKALSEEILKMTDWYTDELFSVSNSNYAIIQFPVSRLVLDPERFEDDSMEIMSYRGMGVIYTKTSMGKMLRNVISEKDRINLLNKYYYPHHERLNTITSSILSNHRKALIIDCHSFSSSPLPYEINQEKNRPDICIGTNIFHTPDFLVKYTKCQFLKHGFSVSINSPFEGTIIPRKFYLKEKKVSGIMIEINRKLYMDENTGKRTDNFKTIQSIITEIESNLVEIYNKY